MSDVTRILSQIEQGDPQAAEKLLPLVYDELRKLAAARLAQEKRGQTLQATALVHEAYLRLRDDRSADAPANAAFNSRGHFFAAAAEAMRRILVEEGRRKQTIKAGGQLQRVGLEPDQIVAPAPQLDLLELDEALERLSRLDARKASLVKLRYFVGLTLREAADILDISEATADSDWAFAKSWLRLELRGPADRGQN
jgi:RNA polymerase sigma factor (TIGR02999 family)